MMKLDWYILRKLFVTFFFCLLMFTAIAVAVDSSEKTDDFVKTGLSTSQIIRQYYLGFVPWIWGLLFPLFVFIAVIFFTSRMAGRSEVIAILAGGISYNRFLRPYFFGGFLLSVILWVGNTYLIPKANEIKNNFQVTYIDKNDPLKNRFDKSCYNCFYLRIDPNTYIGLRSYDLNSRSANLFFLDRVKNGKVVLNIRAGSITWDTTAKKWRLHNATIRTVDNMRETMTHRPDTLIDISLRPGELMKDEYLREKLTTPQLAAYIDRELKRGTEGLTAYQVERYRRTATAVSVLLLTMIGAVIASRKTRGGSGMHLALGIIIAAVFVLSDKFSTVFATKSNLPPMLAAWLPNIAFALVAYGIYRKAPK